MELAPSPAAAGRRRPALAVFLTFFAFYLFMSGRMPPLSDANPTWQVADNLVHKGSIAVNVRWNTPVGRDGRDYSLYPLVTSLVHVPGAALRRLAMSAAPSIGDLILPLACHLAPAALGALTCALFFGLARRFVGLGAASLATLLVGLGTASAYYARSPYGEIVQTAAFTGLMLATHDALDDPSAARGRWLGFWAGLLFNAKLVFLLALPGVAAVIAWRFRREPRRLLVLFGWAALVMVPAVALVLGYNWARWGSPLDSGYRTIGGGSLPKGLWGLLFSPGKSIFLYSPPLALAVVYLPMLARRNAAFLVAMLASAIPVFLFYAQYNRWDGDWGWGPRYVTFLVPVLCLPLALALDAAISGRRRVQGALLAAAFAAGVFVQVVGAALHWGYWFRIEIAVSESWLGTPRCLPPPPGTPPPLPPGTAGPCLPDEIDAWATHWLPALQPIAGHVWLLRHSLANDPWAVAEADAPWQVDGRIRTPAAESWYRGASVDWWRLAWGDHPVAADLLEVFFVLSFALGAIRWWRAVRAGGA